MLNFSQIVIGDGRRRQIAKSGRFSWGRTGNDTTAFGVVGFAGTLTQGGGAVFNCGTSRAPPLQKADKPARQVSSLSHYVLQKPPLGFSGRGQNSRKDRLIYFQIKLASRRLWYILDAGLRPGVFGSGRQARLRHAPARQARTVALRLGRGVL